MFAGKCCAIRNKEDIKTRRGGSDKMLTFDGLIIKINNTANFFRKSSLFLITL
jgi:hypothetical protein